MSGKPSALASVDELLSAVDVLDDALGDARSCYVFRQSGRARIVAGRWRHQGASVSLGAIKPTRLIFNLTGGQSLRLHHDNRSIVTTARCGSIAVMQHALSTTIDVDGKGDTLQIMIPADQISQAVPPGITQLPTSTLYARLRALSARAIVAMRRNDTVRLDALLTCAAPLIAALACPPRGQHLGGLSPTVLDRLKGQVAHQLQTDPEKMPSVRDLADQAGLSLYHFIRAFRASEGTTPLSWMANLRREKGLSHLLDHAAPVIDAAIGAGYSSASHFIATFRQAYGVTPGQLQDAVLGA